MADKNHFSRRIQELATLDSERRLFGCELHQYKFGKCLTASALNALESSYGVRIPAEFRDFLATIGNGGTGPGYGLEPLLPPVPRKPPANQKMRVTLSDEDGQVIHQAEYDDAGANYDPDGSSNTLTAKEPFPLKAPYRSITDEMWDIQFPNWDDRLRSQYETSKNAFQKIPFGHGVLKIAHYGSGIYAVLITNGPFRDQVWLTDPHMGDYVPASMRTDLHDSTIDVQYAYGLHKHPFSFNDWYNHWLNSAFRELAREK